VYALGLILYEMLSGRLPYAASGPVGSVVREILETSPRPPSLVAHGGNAELDAIVLKALAKDPERRYQSADALAEDIGRHRRGELVHARRDSAIYVLGKLARRHKAVSGLALALVLAVCGFAIGMSVLYRRATIEAQTSRQIRVFLEDTLGSVGPGRADEDVTLREVLSEAVHWVDMALADQPEAQASIRHTLANSFRVLGDFSAAQEQLEAALALRRAQFGQKSPEVAQSMGLRGMLELDRGQVEQAMNTLHTALELRREVLGPDHPDVALVLQNLARALVAAGQYDAAETALREAVQIATKSFGPQHADTWMPQFRLAELLARRGATAEALRLHRTVLNGRREHLPPGHPDVERSLLGLGELMTGSGNEREAESLLRECLELHARRLPAGHALVAEVRSALDRCLAAAVQSAGAPR
jgi:serine/threonine-protein kinase